MGVAVRPLFAFDNSYVRELAGLYVAWQATPAPAPRLVMLNEPVHARSVLGEFMETRTQIAR